MKTEAIVASAGAGKRLQARIKKPYLKILGKPILIYTLQALSGSPAVDRIIVAVNRLDKKRCEGLIKRYNIKKIKAVIAGAQERSGSVSNGLNMLDEDTDIVLIHDGVRPFIDKALIKRSVDCAKKFGACVVGVPVKATVKKLKTQNSKLKTVEGTVDRRNLWEIQTPQVFRKEIILKAYKRFGDIYATDDSMLAEKLGVKVRAIMGSYDNIKITTPEDLIIGKAILKVKSLKRKT